MTPWLLFVLGVSLGLPVGSLLGVLIYRSRPEDPPPTPHSTFDCDLGRHAYQPRYDEPGMSMETLTRIRKEAEELAVSGHSNGKNTWTPHARDRWFGVLFEKLPRPRTYVHDVCTCCGHVVWREPAAS